MWFIAEPNESAMARGIDAEAEMFCPVCGSNEFAIVPDDNTPPTKQCYVKECGECGHQWAHG